MSQPSIARLAVKAELGSHRANSMKVGEGAIYAAHGGVGITGRCNGMKVTNKSHLAYILASAGLRLRA